MGRKLKSPFFRDDNPHGRLLLTWSETCRWLTVFPRTEIGSWESGFHRKRQSLSAVSSCSSVSGAVGTDLLGFVLGENQCRQGSQVLAVSVERNMGCGGVERGTFLKEYRDLILQ